MIQEFNFATIQTLSKSYSMLDVINNKTVYQIINNFYDKSSLDKKNFAKTSIQFAMMLGELISQEDYLIPSFDEAINALSSE